ncbi:MAG: CvpA family protein [Oscillospiraceae bacterium]
MQNFMPFLIDAMTIIIIFFFAYFSLKRGFALSAVSLVGIIVSFAAAIILSRIGAVFLYEVVLKNNILAILTKNIGDITDSEILLAELSKAISSLPKFVVNMLEFETGGFSYELSRMINESSESIAIAVMNILIAPIVKTVLRVLLFIIIFILSRIVFKILSSVLKFVRKIPVIGAVDGLLGGAIGLVEGVFVMFLIVSITTFLIKITNNTIPYITAETIEQTNLFQKFISFEKIIGL